jgi:hypothetical protein
MFTAFFGSRAALVHGSNDAQSGSLSLGLGRPAFTSLSSEQVVAGQKNAGSRFSPRTGIV